MDNINKQKQLSLLSQIAEILLNLTSLPLQDNNQMQSSRSTRRKRIFDNGMTSKQSFKRKFEAYHPVRFEDEADNYNSSRYSVSPLSSRRNNLTVTSSVRPTANPYQVTMEKQTEQIRNFVKRISAQPTTPLGERPLNLTSHRRTFTIESPKTSSRELEPIINSTSRPFLKQIVREVMDQMSLSSDRRNSNEKRVSFQLPGEKSPKFHRPIRSVLKTQPVHRENPQLMHQASTNTVRLIREIRQQINEMFSLLRIH